MRHRLIILIAGILLTLISCKKETKYDRTETNVKSVEFSDTINAGEELTLNMIIYLSNGCASKSYTESTTEGDTTFYTAFEKQPKDDGSSCTTAVREFESTLITLPYNTPGWHYLKFNEGINTIIDSVFVKE